MTTHFSRDDGYFGVDLRSNFRDRLQMIVEFGIVRRQVGHDLAGNGEHARPFGETVTNEQIEMHGDDVHLFV